MARSPTAGSGRGQPALGTPVGRQPDSGRAAAGASPGRGPAGHGAQSAQGRRGQGPRGAIGIVATLCLAAALPVQPARAHEWYPAYCCSGQDCYEITTEDVEFVGQGYFIKATGEYFPRDAVPESPDGKFHRCSIGGRREGRTLCLFAPTPAF